MNFISCKIQIPKFTTMTAKLLLPLCFFLICTVCDSAAQVAISAAGGNISGSGGSVSYTVGQVAHLYLTGTNGTVAQGVQQPFEIFLVTDINQATGISLSFQVYPNPVQDFLKLKIQDPDTGNLIWKLFDASGRLIGTDLVSGTETLIPMTGYARGAYLFSVVNKNDFLFATYQIIKN